MTALSKATRRVWRNRHAVSVLVALVVISCVFGAGAAMAEPMHDGPVMSVDSMVSMPACDSAIPGTLNQVLLTYFGSAALVASTHVAPDVAAADLLEPPPPPVAGLLPSAITPLRI